MKLFDEVPSMEDNEGAVAVTAIEAADAVEIEALGVEIAQEEAGIESNFNMLEDSEATIASMEDLIAAEEGIVAGGAVSKATAEMSIAARDHVAKALGVPASALGASMEDAEEDALATMKISMEEKKAWVKQAIIAAQKLFTKINGKIRKVIVKVLATVTRIEKTAKGLEEAVNGIDDAMWAEAAGKEFDEKVNKNLVNKLAIYMTINGMKGGNATEIAKGLVDDSGKGGISKDLAGGLTGVGKAIAATKPEDAIKAVMGNKVGNNVLKLIADKKIKATITEAGAKVIQGEASLTPVRVDGTSGKFLLVGSETKDGKTNVVIDYVGADLSEGDIKGLGMLKVGTKAGAIELAKAAAEAAGSLKAVTDEIFKAVDENEKVFNEVSKATPEDADENQALAFQAAKKLYMVSPKVAFGKAMGLFQSIRTATQIVNESAKAAKAGKESK